jgi:hypothetical protein
MTITLSSRIATISAQDLAKIGGGKGLDSRSVAAARISRMGPGVRYTFLEPATGTLRQGTEVITDRVAGTITVNLVETGA